MPFDYGHQDYWDYAERETHGALGGLEYSTSPGGRDGIHIHFWLPYGGPKKALKGAINEARRMHDMVSYSHGWVPECPDERRPEEGERLGSMSGDGLRYVLDQKAELQAAAQRAFALLVNGPGNCDDDPDDVVKALGEALGVEPGDSGLKHWRTRR